MTCLIALLALLFDFSYGHAYWASSAAQPRIVFCDSAACTSATVPGSSTSGFQGAIWLATSTNIADDINGDSVLAVSCGTLLGTANYSSDAGFTSPYNSGAPNNAVTNPPSPVSNPPTVVFTTGSVQSFSFWINHLHTGASHTQATDGWQIRWRDATVSSNTFQNLPVSYSYQSGKFTQYTDSLAPSGCVSGTNDYCAGPFTSDPFVLGTLLTVTFVVPDIVTSDMEIQYFWTLSGVSPAAGVQAVWQSCTDVQVIASASQFYFPVLLASFMLFARVL